MRCFQENAETPLEQEGCPYASGVIKANQKSEESSDESDVGSYIVEKKNMDVW